MDGTSAAGAALATLRGDLIDIVLGTVFLSVGATACAIAGIRWRRGARILVWWGIFSAVYGLQIMGQASTLLTVLPQSLVPVASYMKTAVRYLLLVCALFAWRELTLGKLRRLMDLEIFVGSAIAVLGIGASVLGGPVDRWMLYNNLLAALGTPVLLAVVLVPNLSRFHVIPNHRLLAPVLVIFALEVLYTNLGTVFRYSTLPLVDSVGFAALLFALGYVALEILFASERRLFAIETELETARQIQASILPARVPEMENLRIAAAYCPMTAVAGDFYEFLRGDEHQLGILMADVSGHGIPAALISSMIKVAMQSVTGVAHDPAQVLGGLNRILSAELRGQLTSAAYLWIDARAHSARYSAAGHPPLLCWRAASGKLLRVESNGLLFGVASDCEYPVQTLAVKRGDRFLLYTDGLTEPENVRGEAFGERRLEQVVGENRAQPASELTAHLLSELRKWQPVSTTQQDDITIIVADVV